MKKTCQKNNDVSICDGREYSLLHTKEFDVALANPPFGYNESKKFTDALFCDKYANITSGRIEIEMLIANLNILKDTGVLLIILPTTIVSGVSMLNIRKVLAKNHSLFAIIDLPINAFEPEKIKCSALIIFKEPNVCDTTTIYKMDESYVLHKHKTISFDDIIDGNWEGDAIVQQTLNYTIHQGTISSQFFCKTGVEILHTSKKTSDWKPTIRLAKVTNGKNYIMAESGDILISRVGASAGQKCIYQGAPKYISDCLIIIKSPTSELVKMIMDLDFNSLVSGLTTPHITIKNITTLLEQCINKTYIDR